jgi:predicted enzyme involved in methoxymalonyl-ACP biosynthesis
MGKTVELAMFEHLLSHARASGFDTIEGMYLPTDKNKPVATLLPDLGFEPLDDGRFAFATANEPTRPNEHVAIVDELAGSPR